MQTKESLFRRLRRGERPEGDDQPYTQQQSGVVSRTAEPSPTRRGDRIPWMCSSPTSMRDASSLRPVGHARTYRTGCPRGRRMAHSSRSPPTATDNPELYVIDADGTGRAGDSRIILASTRHRRGRHKGTRSHSYLRPDRVASDLCGIGVDGTGLRRITFRVAIVTGRHGPPAPYNEIAYSSQHWTRARHQGGRPGDERGTPADVRPWVRTRVQVTAPNGRHIAFSCRAVGAERQADLGRSAEMDAASVESLTSQGNNEMPSWSP